MITSWLYQNNKKLENKDLTKTLDEAKTKKVEFLDLSRNNFTQFSYMGESLPSLKVLDMSYNQATIEEFVLSSEAFPHLECLFLHSSLIKQLEIFGTFPRLRTIDVSQNQLTTFSLALADSNYFPCMESLYLYGNPISNLPKEVFDKERANVWEEVSILLRSLQKDRVAYLHEAKMILIGNGEVGKTSIRLKLIDKQAKLPEIHERTQGLDIDFVNTYSVKNILPEVSQLQEPIDFQLHIWDFGGQGRYREVQQLFCSRKSLYLYVTAPDDAPSNDDYVGFEYWLSMSNAFNYDEETQRHSPIIHIINKIDKKDYEVDNAHIKAIFGNVKDFIKISCQTLKGFDNLEKVIREELPNISKDIFSNQFSQKWLNVKEALEEKQKDYHITYATYLEICHKNDITEIKEAETLLKILDRMGYVIYFGQNPLLRDWIVLNPLWVKDAIYKVLDSPFIRNGELYQNLFPIIWEKYNAPKPNLIKKLWDKIVGTQKYTEEEHQNLLRLMLTYELCYEQKDNRGETYYIVPALLGEKPAIPAFYQDFDIELQFNYIPFLPAGTANKLMVRLHSYILNNWKWKNGMILLYPSDNKPTAEVIEVWREKAVYVRLKGEQKQNLYRLIYQTLADLNQNLKETKFLHQLEFEVKALHRGKYKAIEDLQDIRDNEKYAFLWQEEHSKLLREESDKEKNRKIKAILNAIENADLAKAFELIDELPMSDTDKNICSNLKKEFISGKSDKDFPSRLITWVSGLRD
jgi:GTPase SAR1 family protein/predicted transcriptional regulator YdeE